MLSQHRQFMISFTDFGRSEVQRSIERQQRMVDEIEAVEKTNFRRANYLRFMYSRHG